MPTGTCLVCKHSWSFQHRGQGSARTKGGFAFLDIRERRLVSAPRKTNNLPCSLRCQTVLRPTNANVYRVECLMFVNSRFPIRGKKQNTAILDEEFDFYYYRLSSLHSCVCTFYVVQCLYSAYHLSNILKQLTTIFQSNSPQQNNLARATSTRSLSILIRRSCREANSDLRTLPSVRHHGLSHPGGGLERDTD